MSRPSKLGNVAEALSCANCGSARRNADNLRSMDAKFGFDDNADFRQKDVFKLRDTTQEDAQEVEAAEVGAFGSGGRRTKWEDR